MLYMTMEPLVDFPMFELPTDFRFSTLGNEGQEKWYGLHRAAEPVFDIYDGLLDEQFGREGELEDRCVFLNCGGQVAGSAIAWWEMVGEERWGSLRWVAIHPDYQGQGLSRPLLSYVLTRIQESHDKCLLTTYPDRLQAIRLYLEFGFRPRFASEKGRQVWQNVARQFEHPLLESLSRPF